MLPKQGRWGVNGTRCILELDGNSRRLDGTGLGMLQLDHHLTRLHHRHIEGLAHVSEIDVEGGSLEDEYQLGEWVSARILRVEDEERKVGLTMRGVDQPSEEELAELQGAWEEAQRAAEAAALAVAADSDDDVESESEESETGSEEE